MPMTCVYTYITIYLSQGPTGHVIEYSLPKIPLFVRGYRPMLLSVNHTSLYMHAYTVYYIYYNIIIIIYIHECACT